MIPSNKNELRSIKDAFSDMLMEELSSEQTKNVVVALRKFVKKNPEAFETAEDLNSAKKLIKVISRAQDEVTAINLIADFSNQIADSEKYSKELEEILGYVS